MFRREEIRREVMRENFPVQVTGKFFPYKKISVLIRENFPVQVTGKFFPYKKYQS